MPSKKKGVDITMKFDLTITVTAILGIAAILSPITTAIINNRYLLKMRRLDAEIALKKETSFYTRGIYENYLKSAFKYMKRRDAETKHEYSEYYALALIYFPKPLLEQIVAINLILSSSRAFEASEKLEELSKSMRKILQTL